MHLDGRCNAQSGRGARAIDANTANYIAITSLPCNLHKGTNLTGIDPETGIVTLLFNPRTDGWGDHFVFSEGFIVGLTPVGRTTSVLFRMNTPDRVELRLELQKAGLWD